MIRIMAKLFAATVVLTAFFHIAPLSAASVVWLSSNGSDSNSCTAALPCASVGGVVTKLDAGAQVNCLDSPGFLSAPIGVYGFEATIDCAGVWESTSGTALFLAVNQTLKIRNMTMSGAPGGATAIKVTGYGTLILENCVFENFSGIALDIEPNGAFNLVVTNSRISNNAAGVLLEPATGGSVTATFNGVTIADNNGGGLKTESTNGAVSVDISNSTISNNAGNGMNAVSGAGGTNMLNIKNSVIARNGSAGIQANGANAAALVDTTLLDSNTAGALAAIGGGRILTYGNNRIVGSAGTGFTGPAALQ